MSTASPANPPGAKRVRPVRACTECKQMKLRCDAKETFPRPCSRCTTKSLECIVDANFRRTPTRHRLDEMIKELRSIKRSMNDGREGVSAVPSIDPMTGALSASPADSPASAVGAGQRPFCGGDDAFADIYGAQLGLCVLSRADVVSLFSTFAVHFYPHLPILDPLLTVGSIQRSNPFLFWTIIVITTQRLPATYGEHWTKLVGPYKDLLGRAILASPLTLLTVQGLLCLCTWPLPVEYQARDQSWVLSGVATNAALYMGLHKPGHPPALRSIGVFGDSPMRGITWLACFYTSTSLSQSVGVEPPLRSPEDLATVTRLAADVSISRDFAALAEIQRCVAKYTTLLSEASNNATASSLAQIFELDLDEVKSRYSSSWSRRCSLTFLAAKLHLFALLIVNESKVTSHDNDRLRSYPQVILSQGLAVANRIIELLCHGPFMPDSSHPRAPHVVSQEDVYLEGLPKIHFRILIFAAFFLLRYFALSGSSSLEDRDLARNHVIMVYTHFRKASLGPLDEPGRAAVVIQALSRSSMASSSPTKGLAALKISDRLGASIFYDAITTAGELRNRPAQLSSDQERPQQDLSPEYQLATASHQDHISGETSELDQVAGGEEWDWNMDWHMALPHDVMEDFNFDMLGMFGEVFTDVPSNE